MYSVLFRTRWNHCCENLFVNCRVAGKSAGSFSNFGSPERGTINSGGQHGRLRNGQSNTAVEGWRIEQAMEAKKRKTEGNSTSEKVSKMMALWNKGGLIYTCAHSLSSLLLYQGSARGTVMWSFFCWSELPKPVPGQAPGVTEPWAWAWTQTSSPADTNNKCASSCTHFLEGQ